MNLKPFIYLLTEADGRVRQLVNGVVTSLGRIKALPNSPIGWDDIAIMWERDPELLGLVRNFSLPLGFVRDAAKILRNDGYKFNVDRELYLIIKQLVCDVTPTEFKLYYKSLYRGMLDFATLEDVPSEYRANINIMEGGVSKLLKANLNTQFYIPFDDDAVLVETDGTKIIGKYTAIIDNGAGAGADYYFKNHLVGLRMIQSEINFIGSSKSVERTHVENNNNAIRATGGWFFKATAAGDVEITYNFDLKVEYTPAAPSVNPTHTFKCTVRKITEANFGTTEIEFIAISYPTPIDGTYHFEGTATISVNEGDELYLYTFDTVEGASGDAQIRCTYPAEDTLFEVKYPYRHPTTYTFAFKPVDLYKKLCVKLGLTVDQAITDILETSTYYITSGDGIRQIENTGVKTSMADFVKCFSTLLFASMGVDGNTLTLNDRLSYFDTSNPVHLGECRDFKTYHAQDMLFSSVKVGHPEPEVDSINGRFAFNSWHIYVSPIKNKGKQLELLNPYNCDPYEIETLRRQTAGQITTDTIKDNRPFILDVVPAEPGSDSITPPYVIFYEDGNRMFYPVIDFDFAIGQVIKFSGTVNNNITATVIGMGSIDLAGSYIILDKNLTDETVYGPTLTVLKGQVVTLDRSVVPDSGVPDPDTVYNVRLRPSEVLAKHYRWLRSILWNYSGVLRFEQANRNGELVVNGLKDGRDVDLSAMGEPIFIPKFIEAKIPGTVSLYEALEDNINSSFTITWQDNDYSGFLWKGGIAPNSREPQVVILLPFAGTDMTKLIV